ncbi:SUBV-like protein [Mya arenaria]|uniref:SUBV-like protein n=1 Tax=Mya arenaria TaxID=6604 RepID=A0ABY7E4G8_MYAAR|nr:SUBV-like protein [Mya arenaria]
MISRGLAGSLRRGRHDGNGRFHLAILYFPTAKYSSDGVKTIYQDSNIYSAAGIDTFCQCPPYFDEAQEIDRSWAQGYTGRNVVIAVTDVGVDVDSPNLRENIASHLSFNFVDNNSDPRPEIFPDYQESLRLTK